MTEGGEAQSASDDRAGSEATREEDEDDFEFSLSPDDPNADESAAGAGEPGVDDDLLFEGASGEDAATDGGIQAESPLPDDTELPESDDEEVEPVEVLVNLAEEGEIDPWDIDIVEVTDAFLDHLDATDLRTSGRALFYASVLLRMKSDAMLADDEEETEEPEPWEMAMQGGADDEDWDAGFDPVNALEEEMDRRLERKNTRGNPETLDELVRELREAERGSWWKESRTYDTSKSPQGFDRGTQTLDYHAADDVRREGEPTQDDVTHTTHSEDIDVVIADVRARLDQHYDRGRDEVLFAEIRDAGGRPVMTYLALLFIAHRGGVYLQQDDLFGDLWVQDPAAVDPPSAGLDEAEAGEGKADENESENARDDEGDDEEPEPAVADD